MVTTNQTVVESTLFMEVQNLTTHYRPDRVVLRDVNLTAKEGEIIAVVGRSGCGKTTLLLSIAGLLSPAAGEIRLGDRQITSPGNGVVVVFQEDTTFPWMTVRQNLLFGMTRDARDVAEAPTQLLERLGLAANVDDYPGTLSVGMRKRVELARALASKPRLLLADEPFAALDTLTRETAYTLFLAEVREKSTTSVIVTHNPEEAVLLADNVVVLAGDGGATVTAQFSVDFIPEPRSPEALTSKETLSLGRRIRDALST